MNNIEIALRSKKKLLIHMNVPLYLENLLNDHIVKELEEFLIINNWDFMPKVIQLNGSPPMQETLIEEEKKGLLSSYTNNTPLHFSENV